MPGHPRCLPSHEKVRLPPPAEIPFTFVSDEYNGFNRAPGGEAPRKKVEASFHSFKEARDLNAVSRVYVGVHWSFDATAGIKQGNEIADYIYPRFVKRRP